MKVGLNSNKNILVEGRIKKTDEKNLSMIKSIFPRAQPINIKKNGGRNLSDFFGDCHWFLPLLHHADISIYMKHISFISSNVTTKTSSSLSLLFFFFGHVYSKKWRKLISYLNSRSKPILSPYVAMQYINLSNIHINGDCAKRILRKNSLSPSINEQMVKKN